MTLEDRQVREEEEAAELELRAAADALHKAEIRQAAARARLGETLRSTRDTLSRRRAAAITSLTPGRVQQIIDSDAADGLSRGEARAFRSLDPKELGDVLRQMRKEQSMTLEDIARATEIHTTTIASIERGRRSPRWAVLSKYLEVLGWKAVAEFDLVGDRNPTSPD